MDDPAPDQPRTITAAVASLEHLIDLLEHTSTGGPVAQRVREGLQSALRSPDSAWFAYLAFMASTSGKNGAGWVMDPAEDTQLPWVETRRAARFLVPSADLDAELTRIQRERGIRPDEIMELGEAPSLGV